MPPPARRTPPSATRAPALARAIDAGRAAVTEDPMLVATTPHVDVLLEVTGAVEDAIAPVLAAIEHGKHVALMNPELDGTLGPLLKAQGRPGGRRLHRRRRRPAGRRGQPLPLREGPGRPPGALRQHQGPAGPLPHPDDPGGLRRELGAEARHGDELRRRHQGLLRAGGGGQRHRHDRGEARHARLHRRAGHAARWRRRSSGIPTSCSPAPASSTTWSAPRPAPASSCSAPSSTRASGTTSTSTSSARGRSTASTPPTTSATSRCRPPSPAPRSSSDAAIAPLGAPQVEVVAVAKRDLKAGEVIDELGGYLVYGEAEAAAETARGGHLPIGVAVGAQARARHRQGRRPHLRRRRAARRPPGRQAPRRAGGALRPGARAGGLTSIAGPAPAAPARYGRSACSRANAALRPVDL